MAIKIDDKTQTVYINIAEIEDEDRKQIDDLINFFGYKLAKTNKSLKPKPKKTEAEKHYSEKKIKAFLQAKGNEEYLKIYEEKCKEQTGTNNKTPTANTKKFNEDGTPKAKGFMGGQTWFRSEFKFNEHTNSFELREKKNK